MTGPRRKRLRLRNFDYAQAGAYFVTVCARERRCIFGEIVDDWMRPNRLGRVVIDCWVAIPAHFASAQLDAFVLMPNHLRGIVWLGRAGHGPPLHSVIGSFKGAVTRRAGRHVWHRSFHDRVIRDDAELEALRQYIADNPVKWATDRENPGP
jgi:putative transposase